MTYQTCATPASSMRDIAPGIMLPTHAVILKRLRRSTRSDTAPDRIPRKRKGAMRAAAATPTMKGESVISSTSQPSATWSIPMQSEWNSDAAQRSLKSLYRKDRAHSDSVRKDATRKLQALGIRHGMGAQGRAREVLESCALAQCNPFRATGPSASGARFYRVAPHQSRRPTAQQVVPAAALGDRYRVHTAKNGIRLIHSSMGLV